MYGKLVFGCIIFISFNGLYFLVLLIYFLERGEEREKERERNIIQLPLICALTRDQTCNLGMHPDWVGVSR